MTPDLYVMTAINPALRIFLPAVMDSTEARALILAIALHESKLLRRRQFGNGPARSYLQFEKIGIRGVLKHKKTRPLLMNACLSLNVAGNTPAIHRAIEFQDILGAICGRLLLWTLPTRLPNVTEVEDSYAQYLSAWRPNPAKRRPVEWPDDYRKAWRVLSGGTET